MNFETDSNDINCEGNPIIDTGPLCQLPSFSQSEYYLIHWKSFALNIYCNMLIVTVINSHLVYEY